MRVGLLALVAALISLGAVRAEDTKTPQPASAPQTGTIAKTITLGKKVLPAPPSSPGCYRHTTAGWEETPCLSKEQRARVPHPGSLTLNQSSPPSPFAVQSGALVVKVGQFGGVNDPNNGGAGEFSLQLNSNGFPGPNGHVDWVQFTYQSYSIGNGQQYVSCIWTIDLTTQNYNPQSCQGADTTRSPQAGDVAVVRGGSVNGSLQMVVSLPWASGADGSGPDAFSVTATDQYGLLAGTKWNAVSGGFLGAASSSIANLTRSCLTTTFDIVLAAAAVASPPAVSAGPGGNTLETNNLGVVNTPIPFCVQGVCEVSYDEVSQDWTAHGLQTCYPSDLPVPPLPPGTPQGPFEDDGSRMSVNGVHVHVCPGASLMIGVDQTHDRFLCSNAFLLPDTTDVIADASTQATYSYSGSPHSVHVCPVNSAMVGWNETKDWLICRQLPPSGYVTLPGYGALSINGPGGLLVAEPKHAGQQMHACDPQGAGLSLAMSGLQADDQVLVCMNSLVTPRLQ